MAATTKNIFSQYIIPADLPGPQEIATASLSLEAGKINNILFEDGQMTLRDGKTDHEILDEYWEEIKDTMHFPVDINNSELFLPGYLQHCFCLQPAKVACQECYQVLCVNCGETSECFGGIL